MEAIHNWNIPLVKQQTGKSLNNTCQERLVKTSKRSYQINKKGKRQLYTKINKMIKEVIQRPETQVVNKPLNNGQAQS